MAKARARLDNNLLHNYDGEFAPTVVEPNSFTTPDSIIKELVRRERASRNLLDFAQFMDPGYVPFPIHCLIARKLEDVEAGRTRRLAIFVPPACGKSRLASEIFPAFCFGRTPTIEFIETSYIYDLARDFGKKVRNLLFDKRFQLIFPNVTVASDARAMDSWETVQGGQYKAEGVGGGLIGFHGHIAIIDDPFKGYVEASNPDYCEQIWNWYATTLLNRLRSYKDGPGSVVLIMQRWTGMDLGGRICELQETGAEKWDIVCVPSIAEEGDPLGRAPGEPLLPDGPNRRTLEELQLIQAKNPRLFQALHQQKPISQQGEVFNTACIRLHPWSAFPEKLALYGSSDLAFTENGGDFTVHLLFGVDEKREVWLLDLFRRQVNTEAGLSALIALMGGKSTMPRSYTPVRKWFFEKVAFQKVLEPLLQRKMREAGIFCSTESVSIHGLGGKDSPDRAGAIAGAMQMGLVHAPESAPWLGPLFHEMGAFPRGVFDDQVDTLALVGMKLQSLAGVHTPKGMVQSAEISPVGFTFEQAVARNTAIRQGKRVARVSVVVAGSNIGDVLNDFDVPVSLN